MKDQRWDLIIPIVDKALTLSGRKKETYLSTVCRENPEISTEIEELLRSIEEAEEAKFLESLDQGYQELLSDMEMAEGRKNDNTGQTFIGKKFGAYRITECIGEGGMGAVYKAERTDGEFRHTVAIKLIRQGLDSKENIRRFKMEREVLAGLNHPNIAQLYDGGINPEGIPYLVMEFVDGIPIDQYCNEHRLTIDERLTLFKDVCSAIQYAHTNLVIHRDLKNQNIFVNRNGVVKILDFGVAKLLADPIDGTTLLETQPGQRFWTPQYAAPEQVKGATITTATDIYTLGVLLYKLLADAYPLDLQEKNLIEIGRTIQEEAADPPSRRIQQRELKLCASRRGVSSSELVKTLSGDLDALTLKALRKEPNYRYHSVGQLLDDLDNYQKKLPLVARNDTIKYRLGKLFRRHKMGISVAAAFLVLAIGFASFYSYRITAERTEAQQEAAKAQQISDFLLQLFNANNPNYAPGEEITARDLLRVGAEEIDSMQDQPELQADMMATIGDLYQQMGIYDQSRIFLEQAVGLQKKLYGENDPIVMDNMFNLGQLFYLTGDLQRAHELVSEAYDWDRALNHPPDIRTAKYINELGNITFRQGDYDQSKEFHLEALTILSDLKTPDAKPIESAVLNNLGFVYERTGAYEDAMDFLMQSLELKKDLYGDEHEKIAIGFNNLGRLFLRTGVLDSAEVYHRKSLEMREKLYNNNHQYIAQSLNNIGTVLLKKEKYEEAHEYYAKALSTYQKALGDDTQFVGLVLYNLAALYMDSGKDIKTAQKYLEESVKIYIKSLGSEHPRLFKVHKRLSDCYRQQQKFAEAAVEFQHALEIHKKRFSEKKEEFAQLQEEFQDLQEQTRHADVLLRD